MSNSPTYPAQRATLPIPASLIRVLPDYQIQFDPEPYIVLKMGVGLDQRQIGFQHENLLARRGTVHRFKHYCASGRKFWNRQGGVDFYLAIAKHKIEIVVEHGYSYPKIVVGDQVVSLNVSGGGGTVWTDWIGRIAETRVNLPGRMFTTVAAQALSVSECRQAGLTLDLPPLDESDRCFLENALARRNLKALTPGMQVALADGFTTADGGALTLETRGPQSLLCRNRSAGLVKVTFPQVDWVNTCRANGINLPPLASFNHLPPRPTEGADGQPTTVRA